MTIPQQTAGECPRICGGTNAPSRLYIALSRFALRRRQAARVAGGKILSYLPQLLRGPAGIYPSAPWNRREQAMES